MQPVRQYPLIPSAEPAIFVMGEKTGQRVPLQNLAMLQQQQQQAGLIPGPQGFQPQANAGGPQPPRGPMQNQIQAQNAALASQNAAIAAQNAAMAGHRGQPKVKKIIISTLRFEKRQLIREPLVASRPRRSLKRRRYNI